MRAVRNTRQVSETGRRLGRQSFLSGHGGEVPPGLPPHTCRTMAVQLSLPSPRLCFCLEWKESIKETDGKTSVFFSFFPEPSVARNDYSERKNIERGQGKRGKGSTQVHRKEIRPTPTHTHTHTTTSTFH